MKYFEISYYNGDRVIRMRFNTDLYLEEIDFKTLCEMFIRHILIPKEVDKKIEVNKLEENYKND